MEGPTASGLKRAGGQRDEDDSVPEIFRRKNEKPKNGHETLTLSRVFECAGLFFTLRRKGKGESPVVAWEGVGQWGGRRGRWTAAEDNRWARRMEESAETVEGDAGRREGARVARDGLRGSTVLTMVFATAHSMSHRKFEHPR